MVESFTAKEEDGLTSYFILEVLETKVFRYNFMEGYNVWGNVCYSSSKHRNIVAILATNFQDLVAKEKNLVALAPVLGAIWRPASLYKMATFFIGCDINNTAILVLAIFNTSWLIIEIDIKLSQNGI